MMRRLSCWTIGFALAILPAGWQPPSAMAADPSTAPYVMPAGLESRSISFENPTTLKHDFELLPQRQGKGRFIGSLMGIRSLADGWWGEGELKVYLDGDREFPTLCGTGSEDYVGLSWGMQQTPFLYNGCNLNQKGFVSMYRWHLPDPICWQKSCRVTIQQMGWKDGLFERQDDWTCATFWYEPVPSAPLPSLPDVKARTANVWQDEKPAQ